ncbi:MAG: PAS domain-containing protein [Desulfocucumaceae bacterium]
MTLRKKTLVMVGLTLFFLFAFLYGITRNIVLDKFFALEENMAFYNMIFLLAAGLIFGVLILLLIERNIQGYLFDITGRKRVEVELLEARTRYREMVDSLPVTVFEMDQNGKYKMVNRKALEVFGYTEKEIYEEVTVFDLVVPEERQRAMEEIGTLIKKGISRGGKGHKVLRKDGSSFPVIIHSSPIVQGNKTIGLRGIVVDITDIKRAEEAARESEERYRTILERIEDSYMEVDLKGNIVFVNDSTCRISGYSGFTRPGSLKKYLTGI